MNRKELFIENWTFAKKTGITDEQPYEFVPVELPHDWLVHDTSNLYEDSVGWYKKIYHYDGKADNIILCFDGVYMNSTVYVNNQEVGEWKYGYSAFEFDITEELQQGENEILVKVIHQAPNSRWYTGAGIYRNVWLKSRETSFIENNGIYVSSKKDGETYTLEIDTEIITDKEIVIEQQLLNEQELVAEGSFTAIQDETYSMSLTDLKVREWSPSSPYLYKLKTTLRNKENKQVIEEQYTSIGFKTIVMDPDDGLFINGNYIKIQGVCEHHDLGALGAAFNKEAMRRRMKLLKQMGVNAIRTAHNMPAKEVMELADEMGFLVASESFDMWERFKTKYDYSRFFKEWSYLDMKSWIERDRNHVSLILWTIGNEIYDTHADKRGLEIAKYLINIIKKYDPKGNANPTISSNYMPWKNAQKVADLMKIPGYNYSEKFYEEHHHTYPDWVIYGSETGSIVQSRGIYHFPYHQSVLADIDEQCSALGNSSTSWGAESHEKMLVDDQHTKYSMGQFVWTGFDYIGEPTPYHTKNSYFGQIDTAGFPKDSYYIYQSVWTNVEESPMVHLFPYWDFNPGQTIDVRVASNAPKVELFLNNKSLGIKDRGITTPEKLVPTWQVKYEPGELKAIAYTENGNEIASSVRHSFGDSESIVLKSNKDKLLADGKDLAFVEISTVDKEKNPVENATDRINVSVTGAGRLVGLDNGDSTDYDQYKGLSRRLFSGKVIAIFQSNNEPGSIEVKVSAKGIQAASLALESQKVEETIITNPIDHNTEREIVTGKKNEVSVRKIELASKKGLELTPEVESVTVEAKIYPPNATDQELHWSIVNDAGVEISNVALQADGNEAVITAIGDGAFRIRCFSKNGTEKAKYISELDMNVKGFGLAYKNPYKLISGSLFDDSEGEITNGNEQGIATGRDQKSIVGFNHIDFGTYGSDVITLPIFTLSDERYTIEIWDGHPDEAKSTQLLDGIYQKKSKWNVYQKETYTLMKRMTGIKSLYFVMKNKMHLKGFYFEEKNFVYEYNQATDADFIYGDEFEKTETQVNQIGNNVTLVFENIDFTDTKVKQLLIDGHSPIDKNSIHVRFEREDGESVNQIIDFTKTSDVTEKIFDIEEINGRGKLNFIFLPGSQFDFKGFKFLK